MVAIGEGSLFLRNTANEPSFYQVATLVSHCAVNRAATSSSQDPPVLGCCQQPTNSPASGANRRAVGHACPPGPRAGSRIASAVAASSGASSPTSGVYCTIGRRLCRRATCTGHRDGRTTYPNKHDPVPENGALHLHGAGPGAATNNLDGDGVLRNRRQPAAFTAQCETRVATW